MRLEAKWRTQHQLNSAPRSHGLVQSTQDVPHAAKCPHTLPTGPSCASAAICSRACQSLVPEAGPCVNDTQTPHSVKHAGANRFEANRRLQQPIALDSCHITYLLVRPVRLLPSVQVPASPWCQRQGRTVARRSASWHSQSHTASLEGHPCCQTPVKQPNTFNTGQTSLLKSCLCAPLHVSLATVLTYHQHEANKTLRTM